MDEISDQLLTTAQKFVPAWVEQTFVKVAVSQGLTLEFDVTAVTEKIAGDALTELESLLQADVDEQTTTPLAIMRKAMAEPTRLLLDAGARPALRDVRQVERFPDDVLDLIPATWDDIDRELVIVGINWGAQKAMQHKVRHR